jgi:hypothetical protein
MLTAFTHWAKSDDDDNGVTAYREPTSKDNRNFSNDAVIEDYYVLGCDIV